MRIGPNVPNAAAAQELMWDAMERIHNDPDAAASLCHAALKIDPRCVDALTMLAEIENEDLDDFVERMRRAVRIGRAALGAERFREQRGVFWLDHETRPFMRAMARLAEGLLQYRTKEAAAEAIPIYEEMLDLNPNDNQGVRDLLLACTLRLRRYDAAAATLQRYREEASASHAWAGVLLAHATGDVAGAVARLAKARQANPHIEAFLTGRKRRPRGRPPLYQLGSIEEAIITADILAEAWTAHPKSRAWLREQHA